MRSSQITACSLDDRITTLWPQGVSINAIARDAQVLAVLPDVPDKTRAWQVWKRCRSMVEAGLLLPRGAAPVPDTSTSTSTSTSRPDLLTVTSDKRVGNVTWRELGRKADEMIALRSRASFSQDEATIQFPNADREIAIICLSDLHWGSYGTKHSLIEQITDDVLSIPDLYVIALGDLEHLAIKLRGVLEVTDNVLTPELQHHYTESWLEEIGPRVLCAVWDNHSVMREENQSGTSLYKRIMSRKVIYHSGIGHLDIIVGQERYQICASHHFQGRSYMHALHAQKRYMRMVGQDREIALAGDSHNPAVEMYHDGGKPRLAINAGTTQLDSGYGKRFFSLKTLPVFPVFTLHPHTHMFTPYWSLEAWLAARQK